MRPDLALYSYDLRGSGVARNLLRIAARAQAEGLRTELWLVRAQGALLDRLPEGVGLVEIGARRRFGQRDIDTLGSIAVLRDRLTTARPSIFFSAGNQTHISAALAWEGLRDRADMRFLGRASNAVIARQGSLSPWRLAARAVERRQFRAMDRIVAVAHELARDLHAELGIPTERIETIPNGVDLEAIAAAASAPIAESPYADWFAEGAPPVVLGIGRLSWQKNFELLIDAFARTRAQRPMRLLILGDGPARRKTALAARARRHGVEADVRLAGFVANPFAYLRRAALFVLSSRWEGASNALIEALACGCPVVATACPTGVREVLEDVGSGARFGPLVPGGDGEALAAAMASRLEAPRASDALIARAAAFDLRRTMDGYAALLARAGTSAT